MTLDEIFEQFKLERKNEVRESTMMAYALMYRNHLGPVLGQMDPDGFTSRFLQEWIDGMDASRKGLKDRYTLLVTILNWHRRKRDLPLVRFSVKFPPETKVELEAYSRAEQKKIAEYVQAHPGIREFGILLCLSTGMRIGELCALQWQDLDLERGELYVRKTLERVYNVDMKTTRIAVTEPKTPSSRRTIPIPRELLKILKRSNALVKPEYFLLSGTARPTEPRTYRNFFYDMIQKAGVRRIKFHGLRHSFATLMVESKADIKTVSSILGHSGVEITMDTYVHPTQESKRQQMSKAFKGIL